MIPRTTIDAIREKVDLVELVRDKGTSLKASGTNRYIGLCPVHSERTGSFNVNPQSQTYRCFGCGISGDAIAFMQEVEGYTFAGAVEALGDMVGIEVVDTAGEDPDYLRKKEYMACVRTAAWFYQTKFKELPDNHPAKENLSGRKYLYVEGRETWTEDWGMGYAPGSGTALCTFLKSKGFSDAQILDAGVAYQNENTGYLRDRFRNRLMWEIRDLKGNPIAFNGRRLNEEDNPKYLHSGETLVYKKSKTLYGFDLARKKMSQDRICYVTEGSADAQAVAAVGFTNVVASCGTAFTAEHATIIRRVIDEFDSKQKGKFIFVFDGDKAGIKATMKMFTDIKPSIKDRSYVVSLGDLDPVDFRVEFGDEEMIHRLTSYIPITEFMLDATMKKYNMMEIEGRSNFVNEAMNIISHFSEPEIFEAYKRKISAMSGVSISHLRGTRTPEIEERPQQHEYLDEYNAVDDHEPDAFSGIEEPQRKYVNKALERTCVLLVACMLQFPNQTFNVLRYRPDVLSLFADEDLKHVLVEAMNKTGYTATRNEQTVLRTGDFTNSLAVVDFFHRDLKTEENRVEQYANRLIKNLEEISKKEDSENMRAAVATHQLSEEDALRMLLEKRKKA